MARAIRMQGAEQTHTRYADDIEAYLTTMKWVMTEYGMVKEKWRLSSCPQLTGKAYIMMLYVWLILSVWSTSTTDIPTHSEVDLQLEVPEGVGDDSFNGRPAPGQGSCGTVTALTVVCPCDCEP